jgi:hypothetical protein
MMGQPILARDLTLRLGLIILIIGATTSLLAGGLLNRDNQDGNSYAIAHLYFLSAGLLATVLASIFLFIIAMYRTQSWPEFWGLPETATFATKACARAADFEANYELQSLYSFGSQRALLPQRPASAHSSRAERYHDSSISLGDSFETSSNTYLQSTAAASQSMSPPRTIAVQLRRPAKFTEELEMEMHDVDPETGYGKPKPKPKRESLVEKLKKRLSGTMTI